jgi:hypothetical protein
MSKKAKSPKSKSLKKVKPIFEGSQAGTVPASPNTLTVYQLGNIDRGVIPTAKDLDTFKKMIEEVSKGKKNAIFVPEGLVKVTQFPL